MKRTMKRHLSLILAVLMLLTSAGFTAFAENGATCTQHKPADPNNSDYYRITNPTCTEGGYTEYLCVNCGAVISRGNETGALGHDWGKEDYQYDEANDCYYKYRPCTREFVKKVGNEFVTVECDAISYDLDENADPVVYYLAHFVNNKVAVSFDPEYKYTNLAIAPYAEEELYKCFVKKGEEAVYAGEETPHRSRDKAFGYYDFRGWSPESDAAVKGDLTVSKNNAVFYPVFVGDPDVMYDVTFYGSDYDQLTFAQSVKHGESAIYKNTVTGELYPDPVKKEDLVNTYEFTGWVISGDDGYPIPSAEIENELIYDNALFLPEYNAVKKEYTLKFYEETYDRNGKVSRNLYTYNNNDAVFSGVNLESNLLSVNAPEGIALINDASVITRESDKTYFYTWTGKWRVLTENGAYGSTVNLNNFTVSAGDIIEIKDAAGNVTERVIQLVPVFEKSLIRYAVDIEMAMPAGEDNSYYRGEAEVQVTYVDEGGRNQLAAIGKTNADGIFRCYLNYKVPYTINVVSYDNKYIGSQMIFDLVKAESGGTEKEAELNYQRVTMNPNPEYETHCSCIHHVSLLQPLIVRIFNILYTFFNYKYVCCYDMYTTIGPLLEYTPD